MEQFFLIWNGLLNLVKQSLHVCFCWVSYLIHQAFMADVMTIVWYITGECAIHTRVQKKNHFIQRPNWEKIRNLVQLLIFIWPKS